MATPRTICIKPVYRHLSKGLAAVVLCLVGVAPNSVQALASDAERLDEMPATGGVASGSPKQQSEIELASFTDQQIGSLLQQWPRLDATQRRDLLAEVRKRMRAAGDSANTPLVSQRTPSLTVRIQRAKTQHRYGKPAPRNTAGAQGSNGSAEGAVDSSAEERSQPQGLPRDLVIRATVTRTLPDGSVVTTEETLVPRVVAERLASAPDGVESKTSAPRQVGGEQRSRGKITVVRTKVRFGAGFDRRQQVGVTADKNGGAVRTVSTLNNGETVDLTQER
jgi:hypothetical protein